MGMPAFPPRHLDGSRLGTPTGSPFASGANTPVERRSLEVTPAERPSVEAVKESEKKAEKKHKKMNRPFLFLQSNHRQH